METDTVHGGDQAVPFTYQNGANASSEAYVDTSNLPIGSNWTKGGAQTLVIYFYGDPNCNPSRDRLYVKLGNTKITYNSNPDNDPANLARERWTQWNISLSGISTVSRLTIGVERIGSSGGTATLLIDDIVLYRSAAAVPVASDPGNTGIYGKWLLNGNANDSSGKGRNGTVNNPTGGLGTNGAVWVNDAVRGQVASFGGDNTTGAYISGTNMKIPAMTMENDFTWSFWAKRDGTAGGNDVIIGNRNRPTGWPDTSANLDYSKFTPSQFEFTQAAATTSNINYDDLGSGVWMHHAVVKDGDTFTYYRDGAEAGSSTMTFTIDITNPFYIGGDAGGERWQGYVSSVILYERALTAGEVLFLANN